MSIALPRGSSCAGRMSTPLYCAPTLCVATIGINRAWRDSGHQVTYVQNVTDVDDPLLERANATGVDWRDLATSQIELAMGDAVTILVLRILAPLTADTNGLVQFTDTNAIVRDQCYYRLSFP